MPVGLPWPEANQLQAIRMPQSFHAYVHIPFCEVRCGYCDFNTYTQSELGEVRRDSFHLPLMREMDWAVEVLSNSQLKMAPLSSVFFGGGTPSLLQGEQIAELLAKLEENFGLLPDAEVTLEANPESTSEELLRMLWNTGVNRVSFGAQSFDEEVLKVLDRTHRPELLPGLIDSAKSIGFRTSVDLIYGAPGESMDSWATTLESAISLGTEHISAYSLIVEEGTKLAARIKRGELAEVGEDLNADKHELASEMLEGAGLGWYEVSNWGRESIHNQAYWESKNWWGFGPGAHSHIAGNRFWNRKHPLAYQQALEHGSPAVGYELIDERTHLIEAVMLQLRTRSGLRREVLSQLGVDPNLVAKYLAAGQLTMLGDRIAVTARGRLLVDGIALELVSSAER